MSNLVEWLFEIRWFIQKFNTDH